MGFGDAVQPEEDPDIDWVAKLSGRPRPEAAAAVEEARAARWLYRYLAREHEREGRSSYIEIDAPLELYAFVRLLRPRHVVEVGVSSGVSSAYLLEGLARNGTGTLHSIDLPKLDRRPPEGRSRASWSLPAGRGSGWAVPFRLRGRWDLRLGDKSAILPLFAEELPVIDLLVYDVPHEDRATRREFARLDALVPVGAVAIVDHGPGGSLCAALDGWARRWGSEPRGRKGLGLYGARRRGSAPGGAGAPKSSSERSMRARFRSSPGGPRRTSRTRRNP